MEHSVIIIWKGQEVGQIEESMSDHAELYGKWKSRGTDTAQEFGKIVAQLDIKEVFKNPEKSRRITYRQSDSNQIMHAYVLGIFDGSLSIKRVFREESIKWLLEHVQE